MTSKGFSVLQVSKTIAGSNNLCFKEPKIKKELSPGSHVYMFGWVINLNTVYVFKSQSVRATTPVKLTAMAAVAPKDYMAAVAAFPRQSAQTIPWGSFSWTPLGL